MKRSFLALVLVALAASVAHATVYATRVTVTSAIVQLDANTSNEMITVINQGAGSVYVGGAAVATTTGAELKANASLSLQLTQGEHLYGVSAGSYRVDVLETGR